MTIALYTRDWDGAADYAWFMQWSEAHDKGVMPLDGLPRLGVVVCEAAQPQAVAFLYRDREAVTGWLGFLTTAPRLGPKRALGACRAAIVGVEALAAREGVRYLFTNAESAGYVRLLRRQGWLVNHGVNVELCREVSGAVGDRCQEGEALVGKGGQ